MIVCAPKPVGGLRIGAALDQTADVLAVNFIHLFMGQGVLPQSQILRVDGQFIHFPENFRSKVFHPVAV